MNTFDLIPGGKMKKIFFLLLLAALPLFAQQATEELSAVAASHDTFRITPAQTTVTRAVVIDATSVVSASVTAASQDLQVNLIAPDGTQYSVGDTATTQFESGFYPIDSTTTMPGATYLITVRDPQPGTWSLEVHEPSAIAEPITAVTTTLLNNDTRAVLAGGGDSFPLDTPVLFALVVFDGANKVQNLTIDGKLVRPGFPTASIDFRDDGTAGDDHAGDGIYQAAVSAPAAGLYTVQANARGTASTGAFVRTVATQFNVVERKAHIDALFTDRGIDADSDGLLEQIGITPQATILEAGTYNIGVRLRASNGREMLRTIEADFTPGAVAPEVTFDTADIATELGVNGPYSVEEVRFLIVTPDDLVPADIRYDLGSTAAYDLGTFEHERLRLSGNGSAVGIDTNGNGLYDRLEVTVELLADYAGYYSFSTSLRDTNGNELGFRSGVLYLSAGANPLTLSFDGDPIGRNNIDGPYYLSDLLMFGNGESLSADTAFTAEPFTASQFEGYGVDQTPPTLSVSVTPNVLFAPNHKMVEVTPTITVSDDRDSNPRVDLVSITSNEGDDVHGDGHTSRDVSIDSSGRIFLRAERSALAQGRIYTLTWRARDYSGNTTLASATVIVPHDNSKN
jgi:hypothetical protein